MNHRKKMIDYLVLAANLLEEHRAEILKTYERGLRALGSPLLKDADTRKQVIAQATAVIDDTARDLRGQEPLSRKPEDRLSKNIGASRASQGISPTESFRAVAKLSEATLLVVVNELPSDAPNTEVARVSLSIQQSILERVRKASLSYNEYLLRKSHRSNADERRRIGRELHDRLAHSVMAVFHNLELYELYRSRDSSKAEPKLMLAKKTLQDLLKSTRDFSKELRNSSAEEGLEVALSDYLRLVPPSDMSIRISVEGDDGFILPEVRGELFLILREAVRNAISHSGAESIVANVSISTERVRAVVSDDGRGFEPGRPDSSNGTGLSSMEERTSLLGGTFDLHSDPENGTRIEVNIPLLRS